jgi:Type II CAAX prenyl endopeptidase Rce1-like
MTRAAVAGAAPSVPLAAQNALVAYLKRSERPLQSLIFIAPLILIHEIGWRLAGSRLLVFHLLGQFFALFGATATYLPALSLVGVLLAWHIAARDKWTIHVPTLAGMFIESLLLALPLLAFAAGLARWNPRPLLAAVDQDWTQRIVIAVGAGVYEELIFRLAALTLLHLLLVDVFKVPKNRAAVSMVLISALMFSFYHYLGAEKFAWKTCLFRTASGIYFATVFLCRGFGVTAGSHAFYDIIVCAFAPAG